MQLIHTSNKTTHHKLLIKGCSAFVMYGTFSSEMTGKKFWFAAHTGNESAHHKFSKVGRHFLQKSPIISGCFAKNDLQLKRLKRAESTPHKFSKVSLLQGGKDSMPLVVGHFSQKSHQL